LTRRSQQRPRRAADAFLRQCARIALTSIGGLIALATSASCAGAQSAPPAPAATFSEAQASSGKDEYARACVDCHGPNLNDGEFGGPALVGEAFRKKWFAQPLSALFGYTKNTMPPDGPNRLAPESYAEIIAYILAGNGAPASDTPLPSDIDLLRALRAPAP
jgi:mono/diheme cytochrome c family protein